MAVAMRVLDANVETVRGDGRARTIPVADFLRLPGNTPQVETALQRGELTTAVTLPKPLGGVHLYRPWRLEVADAEMPRGAKAVTATESTRADILWHTTTSMTQHDSVAQIVELHGALEKVREDNGLWNKSLLTLRREQEERLGNVSPPRVPRHEKTA